MGAELEKGLLGAVGGRGKPVGPQTDPREERDQGHVVEDPRVEEVLGPAEEEPAQPV